MHNESYVKKFELTKLPPYLILCVKVHVANPHHPFLSLSLPLSPPLVCVTMLHVPSPLSQRFTKNNFFVEKNPTIVNFPIK